MTQETVAQALSTAIQSRKNCQESGNTTWEDNWEDRIAQLVDTLPSGAGWDLGTSIDHEKSTPTKIVLTGEYHHMDEGGMYDGWTAHAVTVTPTFGGIDLRISGINRNEIKDYLHDIFYWALQETAPPARDYRKTA